jgi:GT2 family glycosyltransferase
MRIEVMKIAVIIPTVGRKRLVAQALSLLDRQHRLPDEVIISVPDPSHFDDTTPHRFPVTTLCGPKGLTAQRNTAIEYALSRFDIIHFIDDDFLVCNDFLSRLEEAFARHSDWAVIRGAITIDGLHCGGLTLEQGRLELEHATEKRGPRRVIDHIGAIGGNMAFRSAAIGTRRFDERLVLYGWQEDIDFSSQFLRYGRIVELTDLVGVHLGVRSGRSSGAPFGYSQLVNPVYLVRKGTMPAAFAARLVARNIAANVVKSLAPEPHIDRRGRLRGNALAALHLLRGRCEPEYILKMQ